MASRMEKYYRGSTKSRAHKNTDLYDSIYQYGEYTNIEGIATIEKTNEIDIRKIKEMLQNNNQQEKTVTPRKDIYEEVKAEEIADNRNYDIRDILSKAKDEKEDDDKYRSLKNTQYDILKNINLKEIEEEKDLKDLINTITNTSMLNKLGDKELSLNMLDDLSSNNEKSTTMRQILKEVEENKEINDTIDKSFFTSSLNFGKDDFFEGIEEPKKKIKTSFKILIILGIIILLAGIGFVVYTFLK